MTCSPARKRVLVIPAAGAGVRFKELGKNYPKCVLPVRGKPIIVHALELMASSFEVVVVAYGGEEHGEAIRSALEPHSFGSPVVLARVDAAKPSPAVSLGAAMLAAQARLGEDIDVTVVLSDLLPASADVAAHVVGMLPDRWGVVAKSPGDYKRWCMVSSDEAGLTFFDKLSTPPPSQHAACGVYRYSAPELFIECLAKLSSTAEGELQFSVVAREYQQSLPLSVELFRDEDFLDYGTLEDYLARRGVPRCRGFNEIVDAGSSVIKRSAQVDKIRAEVAWMRGAPPAMQVFLPRVESAWFSESRAEYRMEKILLSNLRDVALYLDRGYDTWVEIFERIAGFLSLCQASGPERDNDFFWGEVFTRTRVRALRSGATAEQLDWVDGSFRRAIAEARVIDSRASYLHGDLHFANIFFCFFYRNIKVVDPRGDKSGGRLYDIAKLCHSVFGRYDYIDEDLYRRGADGRPFFYDRRHDQIERAFVDTIFGRLNVVEQRVVLTLTASLFLSMLPLHSDRPDHCELFRLEFERLASLVETGTSTSPLVVA